MIQVIGLMIAFYIAYRGLEGLLEAERPAVVKVAAFVLICVAILGGIALIMTSGAMPGMPRGSY